MFILPIGDPWWGGFLIAGIYFCIVIPGWLKSKWEYRQLMKRGGSK